MDYLPERSLSMVLYQGGYFGLYHRVPSFCWGYNSPAWLPLMDVAARATSLPLMDVAAHATSRLMYFSRFPLYTWLVNGVFGCLVPARRIDRVIWKPASCAGSYPGLVMNFNTKIKVEVRLEEMEEIHFGMDLGFDEALLPRNGFHVFFLKYFFG